MVSGLCVACTVEARKHAITHSQISQHGRHATDCGDNCRIGLLASGSEASPQGQKIEQQIDQNRGVAAQMTSIGQYLSIEFSRQQLLARGQLLVMTGDTQMGQYERNDCQ